MIWLEQMKVEQERSGLAESYSCGSGSPVALTCTNTGKGLLRAVVSHMKEVTCLQGNCRKAFEFLLSNKAKSQKLMPPAANN